MEQEGKMSVGSWNVWRHLSQVLLQLMPTESVASAAQRKRIKSIWVGLDLIQAPAPATAFCYPAEYF